MAKPTMMPNRIDNRVMVATTITSWCRVVTWAAPGTIMGAPIGADPSQFYHGDKSQYFTVINHVSLRGTAQRHPVSPCCDSGCGSILLTLSKHTRQARPDAPRSSAITVEPNLNRANGRAWFECQPLPRRGSRVNGQPARCALRVALRFCERILNLGDCFFGLVIINR
jgi:hypothetical protein